MRKTFSDYNRPKKGVKEIVGSFLAGEKVYKAMTLKSRGF